MIDSCYFTERAVEVKYIDPICISQIIVFADTVNHPFCGLMANLKSRKRQFFCMLGNRRQTTIKTENIGRYIILQIMKKG